MGLGGSIPLFYQTLNLNQVYKLGSIDSIVLAIGYVQEQTYAPDKD